MVHSRRDYKVRKFINYVINCVVTITLLRGTHEINDTSLNPKEERRVKWGKEGGNKGKKTVINLLSLFLLSHNKKGILFEINLHKLVDNQCLKCRKRRWTISEEIRPFKHFSPFSYKEKSREIRQSKYLHLGYIWNKW